MTEIARSNGGFTDNEKGVGSPLEGLRACAVLRNIVVMSITRNNHYVPQWYQEEFFEPGRNTLAYLDLSPPKRTLDSSRIIEERSLFDAPTSRAFCEKDLYSTFFGTSVNDEIERRLFGSVDARGSKAVTSPRSASFTPER